MFSLFLDSMRETIESGTQLILVNDGSGAEVGELIEKFARDIKADPTRQIEVVTRHNQHPRGCGQALNQGLAIADGEHIFFVDSDLILTPGWQSGMRATLDRNPRAGMTAGVLLYPQTGGVQHCGIAFGDSLGRHLYLNARPANLPAEPYSVQLAAFALFGMTRQVRDTVGLLDEGYFNGYEDFDYQMRAREHGFHVVIDPKVTSHHWERRNGVHRAGNRKSNLARFWRSWGTHIDSDIPARILSALRSMTDDISKFVAVDIAETRSDAAAFWDALATTSTFDRRTVRDYSTRVDGEQPVLLPQVLPPELLTEPRPLLILTENFVRLLDNWLWFDQRTREHADDIVIDLHGNGMGFAELHASCWPGTKVR